MYDDPVNLFVAKFLGTPPVNVFSGAVRDGQLCLGGEAVLPVRGISDREVWVGVRPEGFLLREDGPLACSLGRVEVMGRDVSVVASHPACQSENLRAIISSENRLELTGGAVRFALKPAKTLLFDRETEERIRYEAE